MSRSALALLLVTAGALALQSCAEDGTRAVQPAGGPDVTLRMTARGPDGERSEARLRCRAETAAASGYLRNRAAVACVTARRLDAFLASRPSTTRACDQVYGGPETTRVRGTIGTRSIDKRFARSDGCEIADSERAGVLLPPSRFAP